MPETEEDFLEEVGARIREIRNSEGYRIADLVRRSEEAGDPISGPYISQVERGESNTTIGFMIRIAWAMGIPPSEFLIRVLSQESIGELRSKVREALPEVMQQFGYRMPRSEPSSARKLAAELVDEIM